MVRAEHETGVTEFSVEDNILKRDGSEIAKFATPISELARLDNKVFVVLHPYCLPLDKKYAGTNLLAIDLNGKLLWQARNLNPAGIVGVERPASTAIESLPHSYTNLTLFNKDEKPLIQADTTNDRICPIIEVETGKEIGGLGSALWQEADIKKHVISNSKRYLVIVPGSPPKPKQGDHLQL